MSAVVAWNYCDMKWGIQYAGYSAPEWVAFLFALPFAASIVACIILAVFFKGNRSEQALLALGGVLNSP